MDKSKSSKIAICVVVILIALTAIFIAIHLATRDSVDSGSIVIETNGNSQSVKINSISTTAVEGIVVNGKGEKKTITGNGIELKTLLADYTVNTVTVIASDEYSADIDGTELAEAGKAYLMIENGKGNLVVFGDKNSKRNVSDVVKFVVK